MSQAEAHAIGAMLRSAPKDLPLDARRRGFEARAATAPLPPGYRDERVDLGDGLGGLLVRVGDEAPIGTLLWLHGGAFVLGSSASWRGFAARIAAQAGVEVLLPDYRLAPEHPFPAAHEDALAALAWLDARASLARCAIGGDSAGGNLALSAMVVRRDAGRALPAAAWLVSPYLDLTHSGASVRERAGLDPFVDASGMDATAITWLAGADPSEPRASPLFADLSALPPMLIQVGSDEVLRDDAWRLAQRLTAATFQEWIGMIHVFPYFADQLEEGRWAHAQAGAFLRRALGGSD